MSSDLFKKMNEDYESLAKQLQPTSNAQQQAQSTNSQASDIPAQDYSNSAYSNQYMEPNMYDPYAAGNNYYGMEQQQQQQQQQQQFSVQDTRGYDYGGQADGYYQNRGSNDYDRNGYQGRKPYPSYNNGKRFDDRERKPFNKFGGESRYSGQGGPSSAIGQGGFHITGTKIFVNNIEANITEAEITQLFGVYGKINDMKVFHRPDQNYAYIIFERYEDAFAASSQPAPNPNWSISLAKSKNTVMQYQQSTMYSQAPGGSLPPPLPFKNSQKFYPGGGTVEQYKRPFNKYGSESNSNGSSSYTHPRSMGGGESQYRRQPYQGQGKLPAESHLSNILNNCKDPNELMDLMLLPPDRVESLATNKTQINQTILVREIWICSISAKCQGSIRNMMEENFGPVEEIEFFPRGDQSFAFVRFFMVQTAHLAFSNKDKIAELLETNSLKLTYSDPSRRRNIIGDHKDYMKDENLSPVLYVSFPYGFKVSKHVIMKIANDYGTVLNVTVKRSEDQKQTSSVLIEFQDLSQTKFAYSNLREDHERMHPRCEFAILLNSDKFIKENNLRLKDKAKEYPITPRFPGRPSYNGTRNYGENGGQPHNRNERGGDRGYSDHYEQENTYLKDKDQQGMEAAGGFESAEEYFNDEDDEEYIWSGFISLKSKGRCGMDAKVLSGPSVLDFENHNLIMNLKCPIDEALKTPPYAVVLFKPSNLTQARPFKEIKQHIDSTPNQAGVVVAKNFTIYLIPAGEEATRLYSELKEFNIVAICHTPESIRGSKTKKDLKIQEKSTLKENTSNYEPSSGYKPEEAQEEQDDDLYDPSKTSNSNKNQNETANLSDLIDNPNLVETMMKNAQ